MLVSAQLLGGNPAYAVSAAAGSGRAAALAAVQEYRRCSSSEALSSPVHGHPHSPARHGHSFARAQLHYNGGRGGGWGRGHVDWWDGAEEVDQGPEGPLVQ